MLGPGSATGRGVPPKVRTLVGVLFIVTLNQFMSALNVSAGVVDLIYGGSILFALAVSGPGSPRWASRKRPVRPTAAPEASTLP
jgi:ribose/xylose/arabinose/galactoside ABC-type transport system permease subunit